jgi:hypothetical protein
VRIPFPDTVEMGRVANDHYYSERGDPYGVFTLRYGENVILAVMANDAGKDSGWWEHVSVSAQGRTPTWDEMCWIKDLFWLEEECVVQYHPPRSRYVNCHPHTLHLWRPTRHRDRMPMPESWLVGPKVEKR